MDQGASDSDQTTADADQTASDTDATLAERDQAESDDDQDASDDDQAAADKDQAAHPGEHDEAYSKTRDKRLEGTEARERTTLERAHTILERHEAATKRDEHARLRDLAADARDASAAARDEAAAAYRRSLGSGADVYINAASVTAARDRLRAAEDRARAAEDRAQAARDRERALAVLKESHLDDLTGFYRRAMGTVAMENEIARARRSNGRLVLAFLDVDGLKAVNDRLGHAAGDELLRAVAAALRAKLRVYDPVMRYGGDEFVCTLAGADVAAAEARFEAVQATLNKSGASISVGFGTLRDNETFDQLMERADAAMQVARRMQESGAVPT